MIRILISGVALTLVAGCGGSAGESGKPIDVDQSMAADAAAASASAAADPHNQSCSRTVRTWLVKAKNLNTELSLGLFEKAQSLLDAMTAATEQLEIEQCNGPYREPALRGNYQAALSISRVLRCDFDDLDCSLDVAESWTKKGAPFIGQVAGSVG